jgi:diacylglycerol kinase family enzyme
MPRCGEAKVQAEPATIPASASREKQASQAPARRRFIALVNSRAGEVLQRGEESFASAITDGFAPLGVDCEVRFVSPRRMAGALKTAEAERPDAVLVAGGDGTVNHLLGPMAAAAVPIGLLPLGTLNLFARDLGLSGAIPDMLPHLARLGIRRVDLGDVNGNLFHSNAGLGFYVRMARAREHARHLVPFSKILGHTIASFRSLWGHRPIAIDITVDGHRETHLADAVLVTNQHFDGADWRRERLDTGLLEIHMLQATGLWGRLKAGLAVYRGTWRSLPHLTSRSASSITVRRHGRLRSTITLDGEVYRVRNPIHFESRPGALRLIAAGEDAPP